MALLKRGKDRDGDRRGGGFKYKPRDPEATQARAERRTGGGDSVVRDDVKFFQAKEGDHDVRFLPPTWDDPEHYGFDVWVHYGIGPDNSSYACLAKMKGKKCPCCEERARAQSEGEEDLAQQLRPSNRVAVWLIDRRAERDGPKMWLMPASVDKEIAAQAVDKKKHSVINLDDPEEGYDISLTVEGAGIKKRYKGVKPDRSASPLSDDEDKAQEWLDYVQANPIPNCIVYKEYDDIATALEGGVRVGDKEASKDDERPARRGRDRDEQDEELKEVEQRGAKGGRPRLGKKAARDEEQDEEQEEKRERPRVGKLGKKRLEPTDLTWEEVHEMDEVALEELAKEHDIDEDDFADCKTESDIADVICERLGIEEDEKPRKGNGKARGRDEEEEEGRDEKEESPRTRKTVESGGSWKDRLAKLRKEGR